MPHALKGGQITAWAEERLNLVAALECLLGTKERKVGLDNLPDAGGAHALSNEGVNSCIVTSGERRQHVEDRLGCVFDAGQRVRCDEESIQIVEYFVLEEIEPAYSMIW